MAYSNVTPPVLPAYDSGTYGFYLLVFNYELDAEDWYMVQMYYCSWRFHYEEGVGIVGAPVTFLCSYSDGTWSEAVEIQGDTLALNPGKTGQTYQRIYTNHNIFDADDQLYMAADTVTPLDEETEPEKFPVLDCINGLVMALCGRAIQWPQDTREPVAYLYGEDKARLPDIYKVYTPEVQKKYPFAALTVAYNADGSIRYQSTFLQLFGPNAYYFWSNERLFFGGDSNGEAVAYKVHNCKDGVWNEGNEYDTNHSAHIYPRDLVLSSGAFRRLTWTNFDAEYEGTLYLAASDPVPVYE